MEGTFWAIVPAIITILLALLLKEVYISLFVGVLVGAMMISGGNPILGFEKLFKIMASTLSGSGDGVYNFEHGALLIFILMLSILIVLMDKSGGSQAVGNWFAKRVKSRRGIMGVTAGFGLMMFMDDYFNRLASGSVMRPIADRYRISRVKLAHIIGSVSASICIIVPISSWSSAVAGTIQDGLTSGDGFSMFLQTVLCNFYPIFTILFIFITSFLGMEFFSMRKIEMKAIKTGDILGNKKETETIVAGCVTNSKGRIVDLVLPILSMILFSVGFMVYFAITRNGDMNSAVSLACGSTLAVIFTMILYLPRKIISFKAFTASFGEGFKSICEVFIILILAWTLADICTHLQVGVFIENIAKAMGGAKILLPAIMYLIAMATAFATGTSWGTFGILVPLTIPMFTVAETGSLLQILTISGVLSGAVFGDQVSPISDATILTAASAKCDHLDYVRAQLPIALMVAGIAFFGFLFGGIFNQIWVGWLASAVVFVALIVGSFIFMKKKNLLMPHFKEPVEDEGQQTQNSVAESTASLSEVEK